MKTGNLMAHRSPFSPMLQLNSKPIVLYISLGIKHARVSNKWLRGIEIGEMLKSSESLKKFGDKKQRAFALPCRIFSVDTE